MFCLWYKPLHGRERRLYRHRMNEHGWFMYGNKYETAERAEAAARRQRSLLWKVQVMRAG